MLEVPDDDDDEPPDDTDDQIIGYRMMLALNTHDNHSLHIAGDEVDNSVGAWQDITLALASEYALCLFTNLGRDKATAYIQRRIAALLAKRGETQP